ncbi:winged helix-turn-helix domain-containing protein [Actinomadura sp.]|uniref:winged helix-turn-helix domain-containing protein n=1 Tax=Actinomadura sp. TaxID=1989 RepID=UPI0037C60D8A
MKKDEVKIDGTYLVKVSGGVVPVRITGEKWQGEKHVGWVGVNTLTNRSVRIKSAQRLRGPADAQDPDAAATTPDAGEGAAAATDEAPAKRGAKGGKGGAKGAAHLRAQAKADQENARMRDEREASPDGMTASERAMAQTAAAKPATAKGKPAKDPKPRKTSALDAAAIVLAEAGTPMKAKEMVALMESKGLWTSPGGKTPEATLYAAIIREIAAKGKQARFKKTERGTFVATEHAAATTAAGAGKEG